MSSSSQTARCGANNSRTDLAGGAAAVHWCRRFVETLSLRISTVLNVAGDDGTQLSDVLRNVSHDSASEQLFVTFPGERRYRYDRVPRSVYDWLLRVPDPDAVFNRLVKDKYAYADVTPRPPTVDLEAALRASLQQVKREK